MTRSMKPSCVSGNLFAPVATSSAEAVKAVKAASASGEHVDTFVEQGGVTIERIVSTGQASPPGFWYDSSRAEWVVLLSGAAVLEFEGKAEPYPMKPGDHLLIEAHCRHRVAWTSDTEPSVWLAVYYSDGPLARIDKASRYRR
ncbi:cupin domain-containing protein [Paraburkholderia sp.]|uniref:cupin domain-containing protein n=1 Tax=Paraburkholderia sp. TaxID=1926495 RepID=UPI0039E5784A